MPTYEYACTACDNRWEEIQKISEDPLDTCPKCQKKSAKRQISGGNFILKGGGWYADLYSSTSNKKSGSVEGKTEGSSSSSKPEAAAAKSESSAPAAPSASPAPSTPSKS